MADPDPAAGDGSAQPDVAESNGVAGAEPDTGTGTDTGADAGAGADPGADADADPGADAGAGADDGAVAEPAAAEAVADTTPLSKKEKKKQRAKEKKEAKERKAKEKKEAKTGKKKKGCCSRCCKCCYCIVTCVCCPCIACYRCLANCCSAICRCFQFIWKQCHCLFALLKKALGWFLFVVLCCWSPCCKSCRACFCTPKIKWDDQCEETLMEVLEMTPKEVAKLHNAFKECDSDKSGEISMAEFSEYLQIEHTIFAERVFGILDLDSSGVMDFEEFAVAVWNYATFDDEGLRRFAFEMYDTDCGGALEPSEIKHMFQEVCGDDFARSDRAQILLHRIDDMAKFNSTEGVVTPMIFSEFVKRNPGLLLPAFHLQLQIKQHVCNAKFWEKIQARRADKYHDTSDGGWLTIQRQLIKNQQERKKKDPTLAAEEKQFRQGLSKEKRLVMEKRQAFLEKAAKRASPAMSTNPGEVSAYIHNFTAEKRARLNIHEQIEFYLKDYRESKIARVEMDFLDDPKLKSLQRPVSLNEERERDRKEKERLKEFRSEIEDIDAKYPKGDPVDMAERGLVGGYNADGYNIK